MPIYVMLILSLSQILNTAPFVAGCAVFCVALVAVAATVSARDYR